MRTGLSDDLRVISDFHKIAVIDRELHRVIVDIVALQETPSLRISSWNVRTMRTGLSDDLRVISDFRKIAVIDRELHRLNVDVAAL
jgi:hypothetical protein